MHLLFDVHRKYSTMKKVFIFLFALILLGVTTSQEAKAQLAYSYTFAATGTSGWTGNGTRTTASICATTGSIRYNLYSTFPTMNFVSPALNSSQGALVTVSYQTKCMNYSATTPTVGATANSVTTKVQFASSTAGPWTDVPGSSFGNTNSTSCTTRTVTFTPASGTFYIRFNTVLNTGDVFLYLDEISITAPAPAGCTGTPAPGNTITSTTSACSAVNFNLSLQNAIVGSGITYQWQSADDLAFTTNVTALGTASTQTTSSTTAKYYRCGVTCAGNTGFSTPVLVNVVNNPALCAPYCVPSGSCADGDLIAQVTLNTLNNVSGTTCGGAYVNYTTSTNPSHTTTLLPSSTYNCLVKAGAWAQDYAAWIDYNDDGTFASTERIGFTTTTLAANATASFPIVLACTPPAGPHRLRVRSAYNTAGSTITPCNAQTYGETEDYIITIAAPPVCPDLGALSVVSTTHNTANLSWVLNCANATAWDVQYGPTGFTLGNGTIVSNVPGTTTATITGLTPLTAYQFYIRANCGGITSNWSMVASGTTLAPPCAGTPVTAVAAAPSAVCSGTSFSLTSSGLSTDANLTYQWESSTDSINWSPIVGATNTSFTVSAGITVNNWYRLVTTCTNSALTSTSNEVGVTINPFYNCYAASTATNTANEEILGVTLNGVSNASTCASVGPGPGSALNLYSNYRTLGAITTMEQGGGYPITLDLGSCAGNSARAAKVWIDYNRNGIFENPGEMVYSTGDISSATANPTANSGTVLVPISAGLGLTGMRVSYFATTAASVVPTGTPTANGEVEDYLVNIIQLNSVITSVSPTTVCANVGTLVITGSGLFGATAVSVGGTPVLSYTVNSPNQITAIVGSGTDGVVSVTVNGVTISGLDLITVAPSPTAPTVSAATATVNFGESATFTASGTETTFNWYTTANGGSPIYTGATFNTPGVCTNTTFYADQSSATCSGPRTPVSVVVQPVALTVSPSNGLICSVADSATMSVTNISGATYAWSNNLAGASVTVSPSATTIYTVTVTSSTCITTLTRNIGVISGVNLLPTVASSDFCYPNQTTDSIFSNLSAGNFGVAGIPYAPATQPATGVTTLASGGLAVVPLSGGNTDDGGWGNIPIGFDYNFFGSNFNNLGVGTNGLVMFGPIPGYTTSAGQLGQFNFAAPAFPNVGNPGNVIGLMLSDMQFGNASSSLRYWTEGIAPTRRFVLSGVYAQYTGGALSTVQLHLYETTGIVEVHIASSAATLTRTIGLQDATKTIGAIAPGWNGRTTTLNTPQSFRFSPPANYTYSWNTNNNDITPTTSSDPKFEAVVTAPGTYTYELMVTNPVTGCVNSGTVSFNANPAPEMVSSTASNVTCNGGNNGWANVSVSGGTGPYTYSWAPAGGTAETATGLTAGNYTVTVTDASLCSVTTVITISEPSAIVPTLVSSSAVTCNAGSNGAAEISATGGTGNYTYSWAPTGGSSNIASGLTAGIYTVTVTDDSLCAQTIAVTITQPSSVVSTVNTISHVSCFNGADAAVTMDVTGGTSPYTYSWSPTGGTAASATGLIAGDYTFTATDANNCVSNTLVTITQPTLLSVIINTTNPLCAGSNGGSALAVVTGGTPAYSYTWSQGGNTAAVSNLTSGTYTVVVTDSKLCTAVSTLVIQDPVAMTITVDATTHVTCHGGNNGAASISVVGGAGALTYAWSPSGGNGTSATGLSSAIYTVVVTDANSCTGSTTVVIFEPAAFTASISASSSPSCFGLSDATASVSTNGGQPALSYAWSPSGGTASVATGLSAGNYTVTVTDASLCTATTSVSISDPMPISVDVLQSTNVTCYDGANGSIDFSANGGNFPYTYSWSPSVSSSNAASGLSAGTYQITVTDNNGCSATSSAIISQPNLLEAVISNSTNVTCFGGTDGTATVNVAGGTSPYNYSWSPNGGNAYTASGLMPGTYTVTITDANNCSATAEATITDALPLSLTASSSNPLCNGQNGELVFSATGGTGTISYNVNNNAQNSPMVAPNGSYTIVATDANGCSAQSIMVISQPDALVLTAIGTDPLCNSNNGSISFSAIGGTGTILYTLNGNSASDPMLVAAGTYTLIATDANGCTAQEVITISEPAAISVTASAIDALCNGGEGSISFSAVGGSGLLSYDVNGLPQNSPMNGMPGTYTITVVDANLCSATTLVTIGEPALLNLVASGADALCNNGLGSISFSATGGTSPIGLYIDGFAASSPSSAGVGVYLVEAIDANGCSVSTSITVNEPSPVVLTATSTDAVCSGGNGTLDFSAIGGTGTLTFTVNGTTAISPYTGTPGTYTIVATDANGCTAETTLDIAEPFPMTLSASVTNALCYGSDGTIDFFAFGGIGTISYDVNGNTANSPMLAVGGNYTITATDMNGCSAQTVVTVTAPTPLVLTTNVTDALCNGANGSLDFSAGGGTGNIVFTVNGTTASSPYNAVAGTYTVLATDVNGCNAQSILIINEPTNAINLTVNITNATCNGANGSLSYSASGGTGTISITIDGSSVSNPFSAAAGSYNVVATDANGCSVQTTAVITEQSAVSLTASATNPNCIGNSGSIDFVAVGGTGIISYTINGNNAVSPSIVSAGTYSVLASDANGCTSLVTLNVVEPSAIVLNVTTTNALCNGAGGGIDFNATGGTGNIYFMVNNSPTTSPMYSIAGTFTIVASDANGCTVATTTSITEPSAISLSVNATDALCSGGNGSLSFNASGGTGNLTYTVNGTSATSPITPTAGTYAIVATDANGCSAITSLTISEPSAVTLSASASNALCNGGNGSLSFSATGGTGNITYTVNGTSATSPMLPTAGIYTIVATDANGCTVSNSLFISEPSAVTLSASASNALCNSGNGSLSFNATGGTGSISYTVNGTLATSPMTPTAGTYAIVATDANGCSAQTVLTITQPSAVDLSASASNALCNGANGSLSFNATGGTGSISYTVNGSSATSPMAPTAGTYAIVATDANGCSAATSLTISEPSAVTLSASASNALCNGGNGSLSFSATGGTGNIAYTVNSTSATSPMTPTAGTYAIVATDANGCSAITSLTISEPSAVTLSASASNALCNGVNGSLSFSATGGTGNIAYTVNGTSATSPMATGAGTYTIVSTDANGCSAQTVLTISEPSAVVLSASSSNALCNGANGSLSFSATGGTGNIAYTVNGLSATSPMATGAGTYTIVSTDVNGCTAQTVLTISEPSAVVLSASSSNALCNGANGSLSFSATGGTGNIAYTVNGLSATSPMATGAGTYTIVSTDANGCSAQTVLTITQPSAVVLSASSNNALCNGANGSLSFNATGGTGNMAYTVNGTSATSPMATGAGTYTIVSTDANGCSAQTVLTISEPSAVVLSASSSNALCNGANGSLSFSATGGTGNIAYTVNGLSATSPMATGAGTYTIVSTDANGCSAQTVLTITQPSAVVLSASSSNALCNGANGSLSFSATGGTGNMAYTVNGTSASSPTTPGAGTYTIVATDANGCSAQTIISITEPSAVVLSASASNALCNGANGSLSFSATGGTGNMAYTVNGTSATSPSVKLAGTYTIVATDVNGCSAQTVLTIEQPSALALVATATNALCNGNLGNITFNTTGGTGTVNVTVNGIPSASPYAVGAGTYVVLATDANGCTAQTSLSVSVPSAMNLTSSSTNVVCAGGNGSLTFNATGGTGNKTYTVNGILANSPYNTTAGTYTIIATDANGCTVSSVRTISTINQLPTVSLGSDVMICQGGSTNLTLSFTGNAPWVYTINGGTPQLSASNIVSITVNPILSTQYIITSLSDATCSNTVTDSVWVNTQPCGNLMPLITSALTYSVTYKITSQPYTTVATNSPTSYTASGLPAGLSMASATGVISGIATALPGVYPVNVSAINQYGSDTKTILITVNPRQLTISAIAANSKVYDATNTATLTGTPTLVGKATGDIVNLDGIPVAVFNNSSVGNAKPISVTGYTLTGAQAAYYSLTQPSFSANITPRSATVTGLTAASKVFDGITNTTIIGTPVAVGLVAGDAVSLNTFGAAANFVTPAYGYNKQVNFSGYSLVGTSASNYSFTQPASVTADIICASPVLLSIVPSGNQAMVTWVGGALNYTIEYRVTGTGTWIPAYTANSFYNLTGLTPSTNYEVRLKLSCVPNISSNYVNGSFTTTSGCGVPTLSTSLVYGNSANVSWNGNADSIYQISVKLASSATWSSNTNLTAKNRTLTGLTVNTAYEYRVRSICKNGDISVWVNGQFTTTNGCGVPSLNSPTPYGNSALVSWSGSTDSVFQVQVKQANSAVWGIPQVTNTLNRTLTGLTINTLYDYQVRSVCKSGDVSNWVAGQFTTTSGCGLPSLNATTAITGNSAIVNWSGSSDSIYQISFKVANTASWSIPANTNLLSRKLINLVVNTTYDYQIRSICKSGDASAWVTGQFTTNAGCGLPVLGTPTSINGNSATMNWSGQSDSVYQVSFKPANSATWGSPILATTTNRQLTGLTVNTTYNYRVRSICKNGDISNWVTGTFATNSGCPIVTLNTPVVSATSAVISWANVQAISYSADFKLSTSVSWFTLGNNPTTTRTIFGLMPNKTYNYRVRSSCGNADVSAYVTGTFTTPSAKENTTAIATLFNVNGSLNEEGLASISWSSLSEWQVSGYEIEHRVGDNPFMPIASVTSKAIDGVSEDILDYQTIQTNTPFGLNQYRIWVLGLDGSRTLFNEVIGIRKSPFETIVSAYPNPASSQIHLTVKTDKTHPVDIKFLDATGRTIKAMSVSVQAGNNDIPVDIDALPVALYTIAVYREGALVYTGRFQKIP